MILTKTENKITVRRIPLSVWIIITISLVFSIIIFYDGLAYMVYIWSGSEVYNYGFFIPVGSAFLIWQKKNLLELMHFKGSWVGLTIVLMGIWLYFLGELGTVYTIMQYSFLIVLVGLMLAFTGWQGFRETWISLLLLVFMIPLPDFYHKPLSLKLQLVSSLLGGTVIRMFGISALVEGNIIDLGNTKLQVADPCSGLHSLFPLMAMGFIAAYFFKGVFWKRAFIFLSTIPIAIFANSFRIGMTALMVKSWGDRKSVV